MQWHLKNQTQPKNSQELIECLLENRGILDKTAFLSPKNPKDFTLAEVGISSANLAVAKLRIQTAIKNQERVIIFGDYDVDGVSATAITWEALKEAGLITQPFIPHRIKHGYGLSIKALDEILGTYAEIKPAKPDLILTVDNGIVAFEALDYLAKLKIDVIVTDHHQPEGLKKLPVLTTIHSPELCGAGVAWFLAKEIAPKSPDQWLDLVTLATIADQMPLLNINRSLVVEGLKKFRTNLTRPGLKELVKLAAIDVHSLTAEQLSFSLIPRLNAMGRMADGADSLRLLCVRTQARAMELAAKLQATNLLRQELTFELTASALAQAEEQKSQKIIVVSSKDFHEGVIGLLAGKLLEKFRRPIIAIQISPNSAKASVRSMPGIDIIEFLRRSKAHFWELGGHKLAAGFVCDPKKVTEISQHLIESAEKFIQPNKFSEALEVDFDLPEKLVTLENLDQTLLLEPFGQANPKPTFVIRNLRVLDLALIGKSQQHLKLKLSLNNQTILAGLAWQKANWSEQIQLAKFYDFVIQLDQNLWREKRQLQLILIDWQLAS